MSSIRPVNHPALSRSYVQEFANGTENRIKQFGNALGNAIGSGASAVVGTVSDGVGIGVRAAGKIIDIWV
ncbi:MAG: hypothetical protein CGU28_06830 [Candidatus Dactylopiibacterium carminicum]|uniref:Uncharacterized protein n=1 Tax=Candidatus Dactylopiibacterium carminicum TaxID=857335 RepID=A0A272EYH1_9RHOO|nr:hypothetical protein [Candidatus Dactylopiibacterium carminicum]KAF7600278.1 hypothetical protein BGI27_03400 [Candidatus Dactylopiibacterium carminicum]PAS94670.1 MAG: hypothetical protein CGU29_02915 [Candidatus Dactylopiibacterium carminicum]PAS96957.1 MAG: hypothetical protein CGU28_06830 [Candidatus Dactylopiibacterium carminicum]PAT00277.1 MAG: hypothetical protein BSR46_03420 [Candidatus Dactylopiibacterium carminicum]